MSATPTNNYNYLILYTDNEDLKQLYRKTTLRLANSAGIIDSGYRGNLCGVFDNNCDSISGVDKYQRLLQICSPTLEPLFVKVIDDLSFFENTDRGDGGFGSTGR